MSAESSPAFAIVDFEASSLDENSFPIEVGIAIYRNGAIESWSSLIRPTPEWLARDSWSKRSEKVHGVTREMLAAAPLPAEAVFQLNQRMVGLQEAYCDEPKYDGYWLNELMASVGHKATFGLVDVQRLYGESGRAAYLATLAGTQAPHRAEGDARRIVEAVLRARDD